MDLYFLRHGLAGQHGDPKYKDDSLRPLTKEGKHKLIAAAQGMKRLRLKFDLVLTSPYLRAKQTAEIIAEAYKIKSQKIELTDNLLPPASAKQLLAEIRHRFPKAQKILLAGHEPHMTELMSELLKSNRHLNIDFKKGGLGLLSIEKDPTDGTLQWLLTPEQLSYLAS